MLIEEWCVFVEREDGNMALAANYGTFQEAIEHIKDDGNLRHRLRIIQTWVYI